MSANDELAGRMAWQAAEIAYRVCAETRHVTLGDKCREAILAAAPPVTPPRAAGIPWVPIADMPEAWKDRRQVLAWDGTQAETVRWYDAEFRIPEGYPLGGITHVAAIDPPEGL